MKKTIIAALAWMLLSNIAFANQDDFDLICNTFKNHENLSNSSALTKEEKLIKINKYIWNNIKTQQARDIMSIVANAAPDKKYKLFKETVELVIGKKWDCYAMRDF